MAKPTSESTKKQIIALYLSGINITQLSKQMSVSQPTITKILKNANINIRKTNGRELNLNKQLVNELYMNGLSTYEIAEKLNCSDEPIRKLIEKLRSSSERNTRSKESIEKIRQSCKNLWNDDAYIKKTKEKYDEWLKTYVPTKGINPPPLTESGKKRISELSKERFKNQEFQKNHKIACSKSSTENAKKTLSNRKIAFITKAEIIHNKKYDYSNIEFKNSHEKIEIICSKHGSFWQSPYSHVYSHGCPVCYGSFKKTIEEFVIEAIKVHGDKYDYSKANYRNNKSKIEIVCKNHGSFYQRPDSHIYKKYGCPKCPSIISKEHSNVVELLPDHIKIINNDKNVLNGVEIDILIPEHKLGIEINGCYWHGLRTNNYTRHMSLKTLHYKKAMLAYNCNIKLYQFWDFEIKRNLELIKSMIYNSIGLSDNVFARKCKIVTLNNTNSCDFFNKSHLNGHRNANIIYGLEINGDIQCAVSFSRHKHYDWEIIRFASKTGTKVIGGFTKLLKHFVKQVNPKSILTFADRRISTGDLYLKTGFEKINITEPNYFYCKNNLILSRQQCQKSKLHKLLGDSFKPEFSETENMLLNGFNKVYDAGHIKLIWTKNQS